MLTDILKQFKWLDIFILILVVRVCYVSIKTGFPVEIFKFLGTLSAIYASLHYYTLTSDFIRQRLPLEAKMPLEFLDFVMFLLLAAAAYFIFFLLRTTFYRLIKIEAVSTLNKWGGLVLGIARSVLLAGLVIFLLSISSVDYLKNSVKHSYLGVRFFKVAPATYSWLWNSLISKFSSGEKFNKTVLDTEKGFLAK
ncbi:MAG: CvpA family protein [Candidatus Omnitrophica bacterium]|nr:CvpA family protein [Candidatus Omnitrophota bacterium]